MRYQVVKKVYDNVNTIETNKEFPSITAVNDFIRREIQSVMFSNFTDDSMVVNISRGYGMVKASGIKWVWNCIPEN